MNAQTAQSNAPRWQIHLFSGLTLRCGSQTISRFEARKAASLMACLAFYQNKRHAREEMMEMLWPDEDFEVIRLRFRQVLTTLRRTLAQAGDGADAVLVADRTFVMLDKAQIITDVAAFENAIKQAARQEDSAARLRLLTQAAQLYTGELLPGFYDDWVLTERRRLQESAVGVLSELAAGLAESGEFSTALDYARRALVLDPLSETAHGLTIRLYATMGRAGEAQRQYREMEQALWKELRITPSESSQALFDALRSGTAAVTVVPTLRTTSTAAEITVMRFDTKEARGDVDVSGPESEPTVAPAPIAASLNPFFGRVEEIQWLCESLRPNSTSPESAHAAGVGQPRHRLVTLTGIGGSGKTRLAMEVARRLQAEYPLNIWVVALADRQNAQEMIAAIADTVCPANVQNPLEQIVRRLGQHPTLLVLDNFEQMIDQGAQTLRTLLERLPACRCLITSRQALEIEGEQEYAVSPLPVVTASDSLDVLRDCPSVQLFLDRAQRGRPDYALTPESAQLIATLCAQLEGVPLAIELAAAWVSLLSPAQISERLKQRLDFLVSRRQDIPARHRSLRATLEWSFRSLEPEIQTFFARLSAFQGGWTLEAAEAICAAPDALGFLARLRQCSLVQSTQTETGTRFTMLEMLREFAGEQLSSEERELCRQRHEAYFLQLAEQAAPHLTGADQREWLLRLREDYPNLRLLLARAAPEGDQTVGLRLLVALWRFWDVHRQYPESQSFLHNVGTMVAGTDLALQAAALEAAGGMASNLVLSSLATPLVEQSLALYRRLGDEASIARVSCSLAITVRDGGDPARARILLEAALPKLRTQGDSFQIGRALAALAAVLYKEGDYVAAGSLMEQGAAMYRVCGHKKGLSWCLGEQGRIALAQADWPTARHYFERGLAIARSLDDFPFTFYALFYLSITHFRLHDFEKAISSCREALAFARRSLDVHWEAVLLIWFGDLAFSQSETDAARTRYQVALALAERETLSDIAIACVRRSAVIAERNGQAEHAARLASAADARANNEMTLPEPVCDTVTLALDGLRDRLGDIAFSVARAAGERQPWPHTLREAGETFAS